MSLTEPGATVPLPRSQLTRSLASTKATISPDHVLLLASLRKAKVEQALAPGSLHVKMIGVQVGSSMRDSEATQSTPSSQFNLRTVGIALAMLLLLYVLSIGPAARVLRKWYRPPGADQAYRNFYWPIAQACRKSSAAATITSCYIHIWVDGDPMYPPLGRD